MPREEVFVGGPVCACVRAVCSVCVCVCVCVLECFKYHFGCSIRKLRNLRTFNKFYLFQIHYHSPENIVFRVKTSKGTK